MLRQQALGACDASQLPPDRLVLSIMDAYVLVEFQLVNVRICTAYMHAM